MKDKDMQFDCELQLPDPFLNINIMSKIPRSHLPANEQQNNIDEITLLKEKKRLRDKFHFLHRHNWLFGFASHLAHQHATYVNTFRTDLNTIDVV